MHLEADELIDLAEGARPESSAPHLAACAQCRAQLADLRAEFKREGTRLPAERWQDAVDEPVLARLRAGDEAGARAYLRASLLLEPVVIPRAPTDA